MMRRVVAGAVFLVLILMSVWVMAGVRGGKAAPPPEKTAAGRPADPRALPRMVDLGKTWCIPCKQMVAVLQEAELRYKGKAVIEFIDLDKKPEAAREYKIMMIPTQIFFTADGKEFERHVGYLPFEEVEKIFTKMGVERSH
ncbi:MAG: thioredoxin family protein [Acidobacteriota bacterium]